MKIIIVLTIFLCCVPIMTGEVVAQVRSSADYEITEEAVSTGGHEAVSASYENVSTTGQSSGVGIQNSAHYENQNGFWHTVLEIPPIPAMTAAGLILLMLVMGWMLMKRKGDRRGIFAGNDPTLNSGH